MRDQDDTTYIKPLRVRTKGARRLLGDINAHAFWELAMAEQFVCYGNDRFRWWDVKSIEDYHERQKRERPAPYSRKPKDPEGTGP